MLGAAILGLPLPLLPLQLLWINLVTDGLPALALVMDPPHEGVLRRPPRALTAPMLDRAAIGAALAVGLLEATVVLAAFAWASARLDLATARTFAFTTLVFCELLRVFAARSPVHLYWQVGVLSNLHLIWIVAVSAFVQLSLPHLPLVSRLLAVVPLPLHLLVVAAALALIPVSTIELRKACATLGRLHHAR